MLYLASPRKNGFQKGKTHNNVFISLQPVLSLAAKPARTCLSALTQYQLFVFELQKKLLSGNDKYGEVDVAQILFSHAVAINKGRKEYSLKENSRG